MVRISIAVSTVLLASSAYAQSILEALAATPELAQLNTVVTRFASTNLQSTLASLRDVTILAPSNSALQKFLNDAGATLSEIPQASIDSLLTYHVLNGTLKAADLNTEGGAVANTFLTDAKLANLDGGSNVVYASAFGSTGLQDKGTLKVYSGVGDAAGVSKADVAFDNGVVHVIDTVLNVPKTCSETADAAELNTLIAALEKTNLTNTVDTTPKLTCFAPTDAAFAAAGIDVTKLSSEDLAAALTYHVIVGTVGYSSVLEDGMELETLSGDKVKVTKKDGKLWVNDVEVAQANVITTNGVAHVLNGVLMANKGPSDNATQTGGPSPTTAPDSASGKLAATVASVFGMALFAASLM